MQVYSNKMISDKESVRLGCEKVNTAHLKFKENYAKNSNNYPADYTALNEIISDYNTGEAYQREVSDLTSTILKTFYKNRGDVLVKHSTE